MKEEIYMIVCFNHLSGISRGQDKPIMINGSDVVFTISKIKVHEVLAKNIEGTRVFKLSHLTEIISMDAKFTEQESYE